MTIEAGDDGGLSPREKREREIVLMIVDALWNHKWIRLALQEHEYYGKGFDSTRQIFRRLPPDEKRPSIRAVKGRFERLVLEQLSEIQYSIYKFAKNNKDKQVVTAADLYQPNRRRMVTYGLDVYEVSLRRDDWRVFEASASGQAEYLAYLRSSGIDPEDVVELDSV